MLIAQKRTKHACFQGQFGNDPSAGQTEQWAPSLGVELFSMPVRHPTVPLPHHYVHQSAGVKWLLCVWLVQAALHDLIMKNLDKIKKPRSTNTDNMY